MKNPVVHFEIQSNRPDELRDFYGKVFDWDINVVSEEMDYALVKTHGEGEVGIDGGIGATGGGPNQVIYYVQSDDLDASLKKVEELGGKVVIAGVESQEVV